MVSNAIYWARDEMEEQYLVGTKSKVQCWAKYEMTRRQPGRDAKDEDEYINLVFGIRNVKTYGKTSKAAWKCFENWLYCLL